MSVKTSYVYTFFLDVSDFDYRIKEGWTKFKVAPACVGVIGAMINCD